MPPQALFAPTMAAVRCAPAPAAGVRSRAPSAACRPPSNGVRFLQRVLLPQQPAPRCERGAGLVTIRASSTAAPPPSSSATARPILKLNPEMVASGGLDLTQQSAEQLQDFRSMLADDYVPVHVDLDGMRCLNIDPPVFSIPDFLSGEACEELAQQAILTGQLKSSKVGGTSYSSTAGGEIPTETIRTSTTLAFNQELLARHPPLAASLEHIMERADAVFDYETKKDKTYGQFKKPAEVGKYVVEMPQVARYQPGQHFLAHEDAFPAADASQKGYQRRATLLIYLNDVGVAAGEGGETHFNVLDLGVRPKKGDALVFFPSFANGVPDHRTLHEAKEAEDEKLVFQFWLSQGVVKRDAAQQKVSVAQVMGGGGLNPEKGRAAPAAGGDGGKGKGKGKGGGKAKGKKKSVGGGSGFGGGKPGGFGKK